MIILLCLVIWWLSGFIPVLNYVKKNAKNSYNVYLHEFIFIALSCLVIGPIGFFIVWYSEKYPDGMIIFKKDE